MSKKNIKLVESIVKCIICESDTEDLASFILANRNAIEL